jgi:hypothetical protein
MKSRMLLFAAAIVPCLVRVDPLSGQGTARIRLVFDQAHGEQAPPAQLYTIANRFGLDVQTSAETITARVLEGARILYLRAPSKEFTVDETEAIVAFVKGGGSLLLILDEERRQSLAKTGVNNLISPFGMRLTPDTEYRHNTGAIANGVLVPG